MPTVGPTELIVVMVILLFFFGAGRLPEVGKGLGRGIREFRESMKDERELVSSVDQTNAR